MAKLSKQSAIASFTLFFVKQKTAYDVKSGLVGSEMCITERHNTAQHSTA